MGTRAALRRWRRGSRAAGPTPADVLDLTTDAVLLVAPGGRVLAANAPARRLFGPGVRSGGGGAADRFVPSLGTALAARRGGGPAPDAGPAEVQAVRGDGTPFPAAVWMRAVGPGTEPDFAVTVRDLTARQACRGRERDLVARLADQEATVDAVLAAASPVALVLTDAEGRITTLNRAAERLLGRPAAELVGRPSTTISDQGCVRSAAITLGIGPGLDPLLEVARSGLPNEQDWTFVDVDGGPRPVSLRVTAIGDRSDPVGFVCAATERSPAWEPVLTARTGAASLLLDLDDAPTRSLRWQVGGSAGRRR